MLSWTRIVLAASLGLGFCLVLTGCGDEAAPPAPPASPAAGGHDDHDHAGHDHAHHGEGGTSIHDIMETLNKGKPSITKQIGTDLAADPPNWDAVAAQMPQYVELASALPNASPERGDAVSWKTLASAYAASAIALNEAVAAQNLEAAQAAHGTITQSCKPCHDAHR